MARRQSPGSIPEDAKPHTLDGTEGTQERSHGVDGPDGKQERPEGEKKCRWCGLTETEALSDRTTLKKGRPGLPSKAEVAAMIAELQADLSGDDRERAQEAARICRLASSRAAERLALIVFGLQPATPPQVNMASITILKGAGLVGKGDAGTTAETTE